MAGHNSRYKTLLNSSDFPSVVRRLHFTGSKLTIICSLMTTLKTCIRTITYLSDIGCLVIQGASLENINDCYDHWMIWAQIAHADVTNIRIEELKEHQAA